MLPSRKCQITVTFTGHPKIVSLQQGTCFMSPFWCLEFGGGFYVFGKPVDPLDFPFILNNIEGFSNFDVSGQ
jgi:hypothetical protein